MSELFDESALADLERQIDGWLDLIRRHNPSIRAIDRGEGDEVRWYVRMHGEEKEFTTVWLTLGQRSLRYESYVMPAPLENAELLYETLLRRNEKLVGAHFSIGNEDAVFLRGEIFLSSLTEIELDRIIGTLYATIEQCFRPLLKIGFSSQVT
ncbi:MAG: YbjN domain-containing protein [Ilumatobacteraceae bacterium]